MNRSQYLDLLVADAVGRVAAGGLHRQRRDHLEHMVLNDVADRAGFVVERPSALDAETLGHRDLHALDAVSVPDRLEELVGEPERQDVEDRLLAQVVIDPKNARLRKGCVEDFVQLSGGSQVSTERFLDHHAGVLGATGFGQILRHVVEQTGWDRQVVDRPGRAVEHLAQLGERGGVLVVAVDVAELFDEPGESGLVDAAVFFQAVASPSLKLREIPARLGDADDRYVQVIVLEQVLDGGKDLLVCQVAGRPEEDQGVGLGRGCRAW